MRTKALILILTAITTVPALAGDERRQLGAHEHGHGRLNIAVEGGSVAMELIAPAADIVGFEHEPKTDEQRTAIEQAKGTLADPLALFVLPPSAGCRLTSCVFTCGGQLEISRQRGACRQKKRSGPATRRVSGELSNDLRRTSIAGQHHVQLF